jgi:hypothetical protein
MIKTIIKTQKRLEPAEKFFVEKSLELLSKNTIDTYRLRINNPKTILYELISVIDSVNRGALRTIYVDILNQEALTLFNSENELVFNSITKGFFLRSLAEKNYNNIYYAANLVISENPDYTTRLYHSIKDEINKINQNPAYTFKDFDLLNRYIQYFYIDLKKYGYNKQYLFNFIYAFFSGNKASPDFDTAFSNIGTLIKRRLEKFFIYVGFNFSGIAEEIFKLDSFDLTYISRKDIEQLASTINYSFQKFVNDNPNLHFFRIEIDAVDYYTAGMLGRKKIQKTLDLLHIATDDDIFNMHSICFAYGTIAPSRGKTQSLAYQLDGYFSPTIDTYKSFIKRYKNISTTSIDPITIKKIYSTLRYLRLGTLSPEQEHKLLNYWIAIEYIFSSSNSEEKKTERLNEYYKKIHSNSYVRRLFRDLHNSIVTMKVDTQISKFSNDKLLYLLEPTTKTEIENIKHRYPLLYYRFHTVMEKFKDSNSSLSELKRHTNNLEWNLTRIYRTRNEIVHSAATDIEAIELAAHLKYYLIFTLNALLTFLLNSPLNIDSDKQITINDFFLLESLRYDSMLKNDKLTLQELLNATNPIEYLQE